MIASKEKIAYPARDFNTRLGKSDFPSIAPSLYPEHPITEHPDLNGPPDDGFEVVPEGYAGVPRPLENLTTDNCADGQDRRWREDVAGVMRAQGRDREADRFLSCGRLVQGVCGKCGHREEIREWRCGLRECPECSRKEAGDRFREALKDMRKVPQVAGWVWRHLTLTLDGGPRLAMREGVLRAQEGLKRLRGYFRRKQFNPGVSAVYGIEFGPDHGRCHVHLLIYAPFLDRTAVEQAWGGGRIDFNLVESERQIENTVLYCIDFTEGPSPAFVASAGQALKGVRRVGAWGFLYGSARKKVLHSRVCPCCSSKSIHTEWIEGSIQEAHRSQGPPQEH